MCLDTKDYFLTTLMTNPKLMRVKYKYILDNIRAKYNIDKLVISNDWVHIKI